MCFHAIYKFMEFKLWLEQQEVWKGIKSEVLKFWRSLEDKPIVPKPIPLTHKGSSYDQDVLRLTGSAEFINSIMGRVKDFLNYETPKIELDVDYRQTVDKYERPIPGKYVCYIRLREKKRKLKFNFK